VGNGTKNVRRKMNHKGEEGEKGRDEEKMRNWTIFLCSTRR
jgi:hypothetical protein